MLPIHFAPLQGYTEDTYRRAHHRLCPGIACYYTPFVRLEHGEVRSKDMRDLRPEHNEGLPLVPQIIASDATEVQRLLDIILPLGYQRIDLNMGCPFPLQVRHGRGAGLLPSPDRVEAICQTLAGHPGIAFSVKMRLGMADSTEWQHILPILNDTPLAHVTLHPRIAADQYKGTLDMTAFADFARQCHHPLIYNGDILGLDDIRRLEQEFPNLAGIMIGRGLLARPTLAEEYAQGQSLSEAEVIARIKAIHAEVLADIQRIIPGEAAQLQKVRTFWDYLEPTLGRKAWKKIHKAGNMRNYMSAVAESHEFIR